MITVTEVQALEDCRIRIGFSDGAVKEIDLSRLLANVRVVFIALRDPRVFKRVRVNPETRTVQWPGEVDLDPEVLYGLFEPASGAHIERRTGRKAAHAAA